MLVIALSRPVQARKNASSSAQGDVPDSESMGHRAPAEQALADVRPWSKARHPRSPALQARLRAGCCSIISCIPPLLDCTTKT